MRVMTSKCISPLRAATITAGEEFIYSLAAIRDTLLPKLISGEIRVKDAEKIFSVGL